MRTTLIIGGTSGLGLELAKELAGEGEVIATGRKDPKVDAVRFREFDLCGGELPERAQKLVDDIPEITTLIYAAGFYQEGTITDLSIEQIEDMIDVGGRGLIYFVRSILLKQETLPELITITSTSQWTPRKLEPVYNFVKAGAGHLSNGLAEDGRIKHVLVAGPAGMNTPFWDGQDREMSTMLDPVWVAEQIIAARGTDFRYKYIRILREPKRVELVETR